MATHKKEKAITDAIYSSKHKIEAAEYSSKYRAEHKSDLAIKKAIYRAEHKNEIAVYRAKHKKKIATDHALYLLKKYQTDIQHRLSVLLRTRLNSALKSDQKAGSAVRDLGCTMEQFRMWLEDQFVDGMTWENQGKLWHIDHIMPLDSFDLSDREQFLTACHFSNIQPLLKVHNLSKGAKLDWVKPQVLTITQPLDRMDTQLFGDDIGVHEKVGDNHFEKWVGEDNLH